MNKGAKKLDATPRFAPQSTALIHQNLLRLRQRSWLPKTGLRTMEEGIQAHFWDNLYA